jgi:hypothetical protein
MRERAGTRNQWLGGWLGQWLATTELRHIRNSFRINRRGPRQFLLSDSPLIIGANGDDPIFPALSLGKIWS